MSTPFPLEEQSETADSGEPVWNPWDKPAAPHWYSGMGFTEDTAYLGPLYRLAASSGSAVAKGELLFSGMAGALMRGQPAEPEGFLEEQQRASSQDRAAQDRVAAAIQADAKQRLSALRPDPQTTGVAVQSLHGIGEMLSTVAMTGGAGGAAGAFTSLASTQGYAAYQDLLDQGVAPGTAGVLGAVRGALAGAGAVVPMTFGASLLPRLGSSMASNVGFGVVNRAIDSSILRHAGYSEMADQEEVFDRTQLLVDLAMGAGFGGWAHIHSRLDAAQLSDAMQRDSTLRDSALTANLALRDRQSGPGVPVDPASAAAHTAAVEKAVNDLQDGRHVDVAGTGVEDSSVLSRGGSPNPEVAEILQRHLHESGLLDEQAKLDQLDAALGERLTGKTIQARIEPTTVPPAEHPTFHGDFGEALPGPGEVAHEAQEGNLHVVLSENGHTTAYKRGEQLQVADSRTAEGAQQRGEGMARMHKLLDIAQQHGLTLTSDTKVSLLAAKQYERLAQEGYEVTRNPAEPDPEGNPNLIATAGRPVFEVRPSQAMTVEEGQLSLEHRLAMDQTLRTGLESMKDETGWYEEGGKLLMDESGNVTGRTKWIPREQWWAERPGNLSESEVHAAVDKALAGKTLGKRQRAVVEFMAEVHDERVQRAGIAAELRQAVPDIHEQPAPAVDMTILAARAGEIDREAALAVIDTWTDDTPQTIARIQNELERIIGSEHAPEEPGRARLELTATSAGREQPARAQRATPATGDLFGEDRSQEQRLADETRRRDLIRSPNGHISLETGRPDDLFSQATRQVDLTDERLFAQGESAKAPKAKAGGEAPEEEGAHAARIAEQALAERPDLQITAPDGSTISAAAAKLQADEEARRAESEAPSLFQQLGDCFLRKGA